VHVYAHRARYPPNVRSTSTPSSIVTESAHDRRASLSCVQTERTPFRGIFSKSINKLLHRLRNRLRRPNSTASSRAFPKAFTQPRADHAIWNRLKPLFVTMLSRSNSAPRDVSGDHVLNKRESRSSRGASPCLSRIVWSVARGSRTVLLARSGAACPCISS